MTIDDIADLVKDYILKQFLPGERPEELINSTPLISGGILDSIATLKLVNFLEERFSIQLEAHETDVEHLGTISSIANLVCAKLGR